MAAFIVAVLTAVAHVMTGCQAFCLDGAGAGNCTAGIRSGDHMLLQTNSLRTMSVRRRESCEDQWNNMACSGQFGHEECHTCGERIEWLTSWDGGHKSDAEAKAIVARDYLSQCGACGPSDDSTKITTAPSCCAGCSKGQSFCSPKSGNCYVSKAKNYYKKCPATSATTPSMPQGPSPAPAPTVAACCASCSGGKNFCSPNSGSCYFTKAKTYYAACPEAPTPAPTVAPPTPAPVPGACSEEQVSRRRGAGSMCSCRRRSGPSCKNDVVELDSNAQSIKVMSYNLMGWSAFNQNKWRGDNVMKKVKAWYPAVLGTQEVETGGGRGYDTVRARMEEGTGLTHAGGAQFYDPAVVEPHEMEQASLSGGYWISMARFKHKQSGAYFLFFNSHWRHGYGMDQAQKAASFIQEKRQQFGPLPVVLVGDSNQFCRAYERSAWKYLKGEEGNTPIVFEDALAHDQGRSFTDNNNPDCRVDLIFLSKGDWSVRQSDVDRDGMGAFGDASDHAALMAEITPQSVTVTSM